MIGCLVKVRSVNTQGKEIKNSQKVKGREKWVVVNENDNLSRHARLLTTWLANI